MLSLPNVSRLTPKKNILLPLALITAGSVITCLKALVWFALGFAIWALGVWIWYQKDRSQRELIKMLYGLCHIELQRGKIVPEHDAPSERPISSGQQSGDPGSPVVHPAAILPYARALGFPDAPG